MTRGIKGLNIVLVAAVAGLVALGVTSVGNPTGAATVVRTAAVQQGDVQATVSTTGNVVAPSNLSLSFVTGGRLTEVDVQPGDRVTTGRVLARVDDSTQRASLASAQANLNAAQQRLFQAQNPLTAAQAAVDDAAARQAAAAVTNAETALQDEQTMVGLNSVAYQNAVDGAANQLQADQAQLQNDQAQLQADQSQLQSDQSRQQQDQSSGNTSQQQADNQAVASDQQKVQADQQKVNADGQAVTKDQNALVNAQTSQAQGLARDQQSLHSAQAAVTSALNSQRATLANNALKTAPLQAGDLASDQAAITSAQTALAQAQQAEDGTTLTAPASGTVAAVNDQVGQTVSGGGASAASSSSSSSGSSGASGAGGAGASGAGGGGSSSSSSSSGSTGQTFISLVDLDTLQVKAGFSETDAARVAVGQPATVSFPALPNVQLAAHVVALDTTSTLVSNVVTYNATMALDNPAQQVKPGMSANVAVVVAKADNVLHVPSSAVRGGGATATVTEMRSGVQTPVIVTVGVRGDDSTEIDSGVNVGDLVVISTGATGVSTANPTIRGVGGLGGLGGGLGGGGGGLGRGG